MDYIFSTLSVYTGSVNDRKKQYLIATYSYDPSMSLNDMEKATLESLGYSGSLTDMWQKHLKALGGSGTVADNIKSYFASSFYESPLLLLETSDVFLLETTSFLILEGTI
jgi:hypothetical protein